MPRVTERFPPRSAQLGRAGRRSILRFTTRASERSSAAIAASIYTSHPDTRRQPPESIEASQVISIAKPSAAIPGDMADALRPDC